MPLIGAYFCVILAKSISLFAIGSDDFFQHFKAEHWEFTPHMLNEHIYLSPTMRIEGNTNCLRVVSQYQTEELALFFILLEAICLTYLICYNSTNSKNFGGTLSVSHTPLAER